MVQRRGSLSFLDKTLFAGRIGHAFRWQDFQGDMAAEVMVDRLINDAHSPLAQFVEEFEFVETLPRHLSGSITTGPSSMCRIGCCDVPGKHRFASGHPSGVSGQKWRRPLAEMAIHMVARLECAFKLHWAVTTSCHYLTRS